MVRKTSLLLVGVAAAAACGSGRPEAGAWELKVDTAGSRQTAWLRVIGQEGADGEPRTRAVILSFDCLPEQASSTVMTEQALRQGSTEVRLTLDAKPSLPLPAFAGTTPSGGQVVLTIPQDSLLALLASHGRAVIEYEDGAGSSKTTAEFPLEGLETYRDSFLSACTKRGG